MLIYPRSRNLSERVEFQMIYILYHIVLYLDREWRWCWVVCTQSLLASKTYDPSNRWLVRMFSWCICCGSTLTKYQSPAGWHYIYRIVESQRLQTFIGCHDFSLLGAGGVDPRYTLFIRLPTRNVFSPFDWQRNTHDYRCRRQLDKKIKTLGLPRWSCEVTEKALGCGLFGYLRMTNQCCC